MNVISLDSQILPLMLALAIFGRTVLGVSRILDSVRNKRNAWKSHKKTKHLTA